MKKICPYCGRAGELGSSCKSCGYILSEYDKDIPGQAASTDISSDSANDIQINISTENTSTFTTPASPDISPPTSQTVIRERKPRFGFIGLLCGLVMMIYGTYAFVHSFAFINIKDWINAYVLLTYSLGFLFGGMAIIHKTWTHNRKSKIRRILIVLSILMLFLAFVVPVVGIIIILYLET